MYICNICWFCMLYKIVTCGLNLIGDSMVWESFNSISICKHTYIQTLNGGMINKWSTKIEHIYLNSCKSRRNYFPFETFIGMNQQLTPTVYVALKLKPRPKYVIQVNNTFCTLTVISFTCRFIDVGYFGGFFSLKMHGFHIWHQSTMTLL